MEGSGIVCVQERKLDTVNKEKCYNLWGITILTGFMREYRMKW